MNPMRRQLMRPFPTATSLVVAAPHRCAANSLCGSAPLRDENSSRTPRTLREIKSTTYIWDDWNIIREVVRKGDSVAVSDNVWGLDLDGTLQGAGGVGGLLAVIRSNSNSNSALYFPTYDANGNISEYVSTNGEIVAHSDYSPFGEPLVAAGPLASTFTHQFSTKPYDTILQISSYELRHYSSVIGKFMTRDPIAEVGSWNIYNEVKNTPVCDFDVLALKSYVTDDGITFIDTGYVNCAGGALGDGYYIEPAEGHSWKEVAESRGFTYFTKLFACARRKKNENRSYYPDNDHHWGMPGRW